jgi:hypothetical protein
MSIVEEIKMYQTWCNVHNKKPNPRSGNKEERKIGTWIKDRKQSINTYDETTKNTLCKLPYW